MKLRGKVRSPGWTTSADPDEGALRAAEAVKKAIMNEGDHVLLSAELGAIRREIISARLAEGKSSQ